MTSELTSSKYFELIVNWFLNLLVRNVIEKEIKREKVQMKPPYEMFVCVATKMHFYYRVSACFKAAAGTSTPVHTVSFHDNY